MRKLDPNYQQSLVDGMYYFALRNYGYNLIINRATWKAVFTNSPLPNASVRWIAIRSACARARASTDRRIVLGIGLGSRPLLFRHRHRNWGNLWDGTMTASERYWFASMRYGDELFAQGKSAKRKKPASIMKTRKPLPRWISSPNKIMTDAVLICYPPTPTLDPSPLSHRQHEIVRPRKSS